MKMNMRRTAASAVAFAAFAVAVMVVGSMGGPAAAQGGFIPNNTPIQSVTLSPGTTTATVGTQRSFQATATLTDANASTRLLGGNGGAFFSLGFAPSLPAGTCAGTGLSFSTQALAIDSAGLFQDTVWSPSTPLVKPQGSMTQPTSVTGASVSGTLTCVNLSAAGSFAAFWTGTQYDGTFSFGGVSNGGLSVVGLSWSSSDPSVATVNQRGVVTAVAPGLAVITATYGSLCWQTLPDNGWCRGTISATATIEVTPAGNGGGNGGGGGGGGGGNGPVLTAGPDRTLECTAPFASPVQLEGAIFFQPQTPLTYTWTGPFGNASGLTPVVGLPLGANSLTFTISDGVRSASDGVVITMLDTAAPAIAAVTASPSVLWPPNHKMVPVALSVSATDSCDASVACRIVSVSSNEGGPADYEITGPLTMRLRSERLGTGTGRVYSAAVTCADGSGNTTRKSVDIVVPHNR